MKREKSCGALVFRTNPDGSHLLLLIKHKFGGHWSFPKGHMESGETEVQTALREVREETGLPIRLLPRFRYTVEYFPKPNIKKLVVYFLGEALDDHIVRQEEEIGEIQWVPIRAAAEIVTFRNDKNLIGKALRRLEPGQAAEAPSAGQAPPAAE